MLKCTICDKVPLKNDVLCKEHKQEALKEYFQELSEGYFVEELEASSNTCLSLLICITDQAS